MAESVIKDKSMISSSESFEIKCPSTNSSDVPLILNKLYGLETTSVTEFKSYDDKNFHVEVKENCSNSHISTLSPNGYVLKILNTDDSQHVDVAEGQNLLMNYLKSCNFNVPTPIKSIDGSLLVNQSLPLQKLPSTGLPKHIIRLLNFVPGKLLYDVPLGKQLLYELGEYIGKLSKSLKDFHHDGINNRNYRWQLHRLPEVLQYKSAVDDPVKQALVEKVIEAWNSVVLPVIPLLEKGIIHGDINEQNILVSSKENQKEFHICGILDFGDVNRSCCVFDVAISIMYMMIIVKDIDPIDAGGHILAGYVKRRQLTPDELHILKECICGRFAQSLVYGTYSYSLNPSNTYLLTTTNSWGVLESFFNTRKQDIIARWREICKTYGVEL